jgi:hypothetical protein
MGGGMARSVVTRSVGLMQVHSVSQSSEEPSDSREEEEAVDQPQCYFTITTTDGEVHVFETASPEDCSKLVRGMQHLIARFCSQVIKGDSNAVLDFYLANDPANIRFTPEEAMMRISHTLLDS